MIQKIPHVDLTPSQKKQLAQIMAAGNKELKKLHARTTEKCSLATFRKELFATVHNNNPVKMVRGVRIPKASIATIMAVKSIEWQMLTGHGKFISKQAKRWKQTLQNTGLTYADIYQEVTVGVINAIWNYDKTNIKFLTYVHNAVFNRMMGVSNHTRSLSHLQDCDIKLLGAYVKKRQALATTGPISFDDVVTALGLKPEQIFRLRKALQSASPESCIRTGTKAIDENGGILQTAVAHEIKPYVHTTDDESKEPAAKPVISAELRELLDKVELSPWERAVLDGYLTGGAGWRTHVANSNINPKTGKPYSRMYPILTMNKIINNLKKAHAA